MSNKKVPKLSGGPYMHIHTQSCKNGKISLLTHHLKSLLNVKYYELPIYRQYYAPRDAKVFLK